MKKLPIGIQNITEILTNNHLYIDKTAIIHQLITSGVAYFLSRPRRFGKSLLISTLEAIFQGKRDLFNKLAISKTDWQWREHPVIKLDFSTLSRSSVEELSQSLLSHLSAIAKKHQVNLAPQTHPKMMLSDLIKQLAKINPVVVLIDEYDSPVNNHLASNPELAQQNNEFLQDFACTIKANDEHIEFVFVTGICKFSLASVFSGFNHLNDISRDDPYANLVGVSEQEIDTYCADHVSELAKAEQLTIDQTREKMRQWYNGFRFSQQAISVYPPFSLLLLFNRRDFNHYWFESGGVPNVLTNLVRDKHDDVQKLESTRVSEFAFWIDDIKRLDVIALLLQTGYLSIKDYERKYDRGLYTVGYTNPEIAKLFRRYLIDNFSDIHAGMVVHYLVRCINELNDNDLSGFFYQFSNFFAHGCDKKHYLNLLYLLFKSLGELIPTDIETQQTGINAAIETASHYYLIQFNSDGTAEQAMAQIQQKGYDKKYREQGKAIVFVGVNVSKQLCDIDDYIFE